MKVICYGDSNTYGYDPRSFLGDRYSVDCRWVDIFAKKTGWNVINDGMNGREIPRNTVHISEDTDLLIVMLGTNDLLQGRTVSELSERMENFLSGLTLQKEQILLIAPPPMQFGEWITDKRLIDASVELAQSYRMLSERFGIRFVDAGKWNIAMTFDGVHFTETGHKAFAQGLYQYLNKAE